MSSKNNSSLYAKTLAAATGSTLTGLTMTPFDVIKTRLQTQPPASTTTHFPKSSSTIPPPGCCQPSPADCVRNIHSFALSASTHHSKSLHVPRPTLNAGSNSVICLWDGGWTKVQRVNGFWDAAWTVWKAEGVAGLWKGVGTTLMIAVPSQTAYMLTYDALLNNVLPHSSCTPLVAGMLARATVSSITSPLELLRTRLQSTPASPLNPHTLKSTLIGIQSMVQTSGIRSLWLGLSSTLWRDVPFSGIYWIGYENGRAALRRRGYEGPAAAFASGATSGTVAALLTSPFDVLKTRKQAYLQTKSSGSMSTLAVSIRVIRAEGYQALFAGLTPRLAKIAPACGIMISCYEGFSQYLSDTHS